MPTKQYELPDLPYAYDALEPVYSRELLELHHDKHHAAYVKGANSTIEQLSGVREKGDYSTINQLEKNLAFHLSGHLLHSLFWKNMSPDGGGSPEGELLGSIDEGFGGTDALRAQMTAAALAIQGSGWGALSWDPLGARLIVEQIHDHQGNAGSGTVPLLVLDMWEHAFYLQYRNEKQKWANAFWDLVNWPDVAKRLQSAQSLNLSLDV
jgi:Fe-Mn family superoxide dismutase